MGIGSKVKAQPAGTPAGTVIPGAVVEEEPEIRNTATAPGFDKIEANMQKATALSQDGKKYVADLTALLAQKSDGTITVESLGHRIETLVALDHVTKQAFMVIFNESFVTSQPYVPAGDYIIDLAKCLQDVHPDYALLEYVNICDYDYGLVENMASFIVNAFKATTPENRLDRTSFHSIQVVAQADLQQALTFISRNSPHKYRQRADWGVTVSRKVMPLHQQMFNNRDQNLLPMMAITGYTKIMRIRNPQPIGAVYNPIRFVPVVVITEVMATVPSFDMLSLALPIVAGTVIQSRKWLAPYCTGTQKGPNLGRLKIVTDANGQQSLGWFENCDRIPEVIQDVPWLAIDFAEGRATIPGLANYVTNDPTNPAMDHVNAQLKRFFGETDANGNPIVYMPASVSPVLTSFVNYEGTYTRDGVLTDTRTADYINTITEIQDFGRCERMLDQSSVQPAQHLQDVAAIYGEDTVKSLYRVTTVVFNGQYINTLANLVSGILQYQADLAVNQNIDFGQFLGQYNTPIGGANSIYGGVYGGQVGTMGYYNRGGMGW